MTTAEDLARIARMHALLAMREQQTVATTPPAAPELRDGRIQREDVCRDLATIQRQLGLSAA